MEDKPTLVYLKEASKQVRCFISKSLHDAGIEDLSPHEANTLFYLTNHEGVSSGELQRAQSVSKASVSDALAHLVERGYIEYLNSDTDRREKRIVLTEKGKDHQRRVGEVIKKAKQSLLNGVSSEEEAIARQFLVHLINNAKGGNHD